MTQDEKFMHRALFLAKKGRGLVEPNPYVGCVVVKDGKIISEGFHRSFGSWHAEIEALKKLTPTQARGTTLYVNLEPCVHFGKTPPCVPAIIRSGVSKVVVSMKDPSRKVFGQGILMLKKSGINVIEGVLGKESKKLNEKFINNIKNKKTHVALKIAMSLDGKIATRTGDSKWITSETSRKHVKKMRDEFDAILVGKNTVIRDNPTLQGRTNEPIRIILDSRFESPLSSNVFRNKRALLVTTNLVKKSKLKKLQGRGIMVKKFTGKIRIHPLLQYLKSIGISKLLVEGGSEIFGSFIDERAANEIFFFIAPKIIGGRSAKPAIGGKGIKMMDQALQFAFQEKSIKKIGQDIFLKVQF